MKVVRWVVNFICIAIIIFAGFGLVNSIAISFFILSGQLTVGQPMWVDSITPDFISLLKTIGISISLIIVCIIIRAIVCKKYDFKFLQPKNT